MGYTIEKNQMLEIDIRDNNTNSIDKKELTNENSIRNDENNKQEEISNNTNKLEYLE